MARGDSINSLLQMQAYRRAEMEGQIAKRDVYGETKAFVEQWRKNNGLEGTKALPNRNEVPFQWMIPFLDKVETDDTKPSPLIATHDKPGIGRNSPPASSGDNLAPDWLIDYMNRKDENLLQTQDRLKRVEAPTNNDMLIAETAADMERPTTGGYFLDGKGGAFINTPDGLIYDGEYNPDIHGMPVPLAKGNKSMLIAGGKKSDEQRAYEDFVKDSGSQPLDEQLMDMDKGRMGGGLDILDDLLFTDTV